MEQADPLLSDIWQTACRHIEIGESAALIGRLLAPRLPLRTLLVRRIDAERGWVETVGSSGESAARSENGHGPAEPVRSALSPAACKRLLAWLRSRGIETWKNSRCQERAIVPVVPAEIRNEAVVVPLLSEHETMGVLIIEARAGEHFTAAHRHLARMLLEPFAAALENDRRLQELTALRQAAEADRQSLLRRLGREELVDVVIGAEGGLKPVMERVELVARADAPVLLLGDTGSGKEVVARAIHVRSPRSAGPFIRVNCGAIPTELIDSELFGHEKGSFTGATSVRRGWFERADEGTLFLDEIGELPLAAQVRLLRILQEGTFERVGGEETLKVDVRIVAATNRDLPAMVQQGRFREDLWYRVAVFPIVLPPLREHKQDIPELAEHFARRAARRYGVTEVLPGPAEVEVLTRYDWPGNVRELASVIDRAVILGNGARLEIFKALGAPSAAAAAPARNGSTPAPSVAPLKDAMRGHIEAALAASRGKIEGAAGAAAALGINPHTLRARMRKLGLDWSRFRP